MNSFELNSKRPILYFGRIAESKGIQTLIKAVYTIYREEFNQIAPLWILGGNSLEIAAFKNNEEIASIIEELEAQNLLFWWGHVPHDYLPFILGKCSFFCFSSKYEPGGRTIIEAMAMGLPVLATAQGFAPEIIKNGINGFIIKDDSLIAWVEKIKYMLINKDVIKKMRIEAVKTIKDNYTMAHFFERHWEIYQQFQPKIK